MPSSLEKIGDNLKAHGEHNFRELRQEYPKTEEFQLLLGKGKFPYEYLTDVATLHDPCPDHLAFYSSLKNENITTEEYETVQQIFKTFNLSTVGDLLELYVKQDVLILTDCVNFYRQMVRDSYNLEAFSYYSSPSLTLDASLKFTGVEIELIKDPTQYMFVESAIRGGVSVASSHYCKANNKYMEDFNPNEKSSYIFYGDVTNL